MVGKELLAVVSFRELSVDIFRDRNAQSCVSSAVSLFTIREYPCLATLDYEKLIFARGSSSGLISNHSVDPQAREAKIDREATLTSSTLISAKIR